MELPCGKKGWTAYTRTRNKRGIKASPKDGSLANGAQDRFDERIWNSFDLAGRRHPHPKAERRLIASPMPDLA